jgi:hypothetical protein
LINLSFLKVKQYQQDLNFKSVAWERLQTETSITGRSSCNTSHFLVIGDRFAREKEDLARGTAGSIMPASAD